MKIGIVTVYKSSNYGAFHQALALRRYLEKKGHEVYFIKHTARRPLVSLLGKVYDAVSSREVKGIPFLLKQECRFAKCREEFKECTLEKASELDMVILGSDEIWNITRKKIRNYPLFFGKEIENGNIISYAPSVNNASIEDFYNQPQIIEQLKKLTGVSVRDSHSKNVIESILEKEIPLVTDPTMLHDKAYYLENTRDVEMEKPYILVYSYGKERKEQANEIKNLREFASDNNMQIISVMGYLGWVDKNIAVYPSDVFSYFKSAEFIVTDTFHGTIFSLMTEKNFWILPSTSKKLEELLNAVDLNNRTLRDIKGQDYVDCRIEYELVNEKIGEMRRKSVEFLEPYINKEN